MKKLEKLLKSHKHLVFLDFEGTQFSHEMIAVGAVLVSLDRHGKIKRMKKPFLRYVKAKNKVGKYVTDLTGITDAKLQADGISFAKAMTDLKKYVGHNFLRCSFVTFGNHDMRILGQSIAYNFDFPKDICSQIQKNYVDFASFLGEFIRDSKGNPLSLIHNCELFGVTLSEPAHSPDADALNLAKLYNAFLSHGEIVLAGYKNALILVNHFPEPVKNTIARLTNGETVTSEEFEKQLKLYLE